MSELRLQNIFVPLLGKATEVAYYQHPEAADTILLLHEALGSVAYWKDFPEQLALATGANVLLYSRAGHGQSEGPLVVRNRESYLREAQQVIPALLAHFAVERPVVYGHSEGAGLAMLFAATMQTAKLLILESPFVVASETSHQFILNMAAGYQGSHLQQRLANYHRDADAVFASWIAGVKELRANEAPFREFLPRILCPVLVLQGADDEFGTTRHLQALLAALPHLEHEMLADAGHLPHRQQTEAVLARVRRFLAENG
jgi:pimeloyl-ACP methyl ester carboxylesterase